MTRGLEFRGCLCLAA